MNRSPVRPCPSPNWRERRRQQDLALLRHEQWQDFGEEGAPPLVRHQLRSPLLFPASLGGPIRLDNWRTRSWYPAVDAAGVERRGPYALRHTAITSWLAAGVPIFDVARYAGTSLTMVEKTYGHLAVGSEELARQRLDAYRQRLGQEWATP